MVAQACFELLDEQEVTSWPSPRWRNDPVGFARDVLGVELWSAQVELLEAIRDNRNVTCRSGHKVGKSTTLAVAALWFFCSFDRARVVLTAVKATQIDEVIWKEVRRLYRRAQRGWTKEHERAGRGPHPVGGELFVLARTGLRDDDERQIMGVTARDGEGLAGISGPNILVLCDEASGINDRFFEVLGSSLAGSGDADDRVRKCYISNPTRTHGEFYRSHTVNSALYKCLHISSEDTPNARGTGVVRGLAGPEWIAEKAAEYGVDSPQYAVRVRGEFVHDKDGKIISLDLLAMAEEAWDDMPETGPLQIGVDPAGDGVNGDESVVAVRRGNKIVTVLAWRGQTEDAVVEHVAAALKQYRRPNEPAAPRVCIDAEGGIGARVLNKLRVRLDTTGAQVVGVRSGKKFYGSPEFHLIRDGLWGEAKKFLEGGGALPSDVKLAQELNAPSFTADANQRYVATPKPELRKALGRSTDRADAVCLAIWGFMGQSVDEVVDDAREAGDVWNYAADDAYELDGLGGGDPVYG